MILPSKFLCLKIFYLTNRPHMVNRGDDADCFGFAEISALKRINESRLFSSAEQYVVIECTSDLKLEFPNGIFLEN